MTRLLAVALLCAGLAACGDSESGAGKPGAGATPAGTPVEAEPVTVGPLAQEIVAVGSLRSEESVTVRSEIAGRIARVAFEEGQRVREGDLLFQLDDSVHRAEAEQARAAWQLSRRNHQRARDLAAQKLISASDRDAAQSKLDVDQASLRLAEARLAKTRITAPFAGVVGLRSVSPGDYVGPGQDLVSLEALDNMKVDFRLAEAALPVLAVGQSLSVEVDAYPDQTFTALVYAIDPRLADESRSIALRAHLPNTEGKLRPGQFARVRLTVAQKPNAMVVPEQAIVPQGQQLFVYVVEQGKAALRPVTVGTRQGGKAEILTGLSPGDLVITAGVQKIGPGAAVAPIRRPPAGPTPTTG